MSYRRILQERVEFSDKLLSDLRSYLKAHIPPEYSVVVTGSIARREAAPTSDVDYFIVVDDARGVPNIAQKVSALIFEVGKAIEAVGLRPPALGGAFGADWESLRSMRENVGGNDDPNIKLTHRLLLLLEGDWLAGEQTFWEAQRQLVEDVYVRDEISDHQIARFLLNDLIRYWRTIAVDFEYKTVEKGKGWGIRNIKLVYSRKLLYFSGILMVAETAQSTRNSKVDRVNEMLRMTPIQRIESVFGAECEKTLAMYAHFLSQVADPSVRQRFEEITLDRGSHTEEFKRLKNLSHHFSMQLEQLMRNAYPPSHPIHHAMLF